MSILMASNPQEDFDILPGLKSPILERKRKSESRFFTAYLYFVKEAAKKYGLPEDNLYDVYTDSVLAALSGTRSPKC